MLKFRGHVLPGNYNFTTNTSTSEDELKAPRSRMANPTADWEKVGDKFYRKIQLYTAVFDQDLELENYIVTGCSYGGAIGMPLLPAFRKFA
jgi:hypothetical protein